MTWLARQPGGIPMPEPTALTAPFWEGCARGELRFQRCAGCAAPTFVPDLVCRACGGRDLRWERSSGRGQIETWSVVWRPQVPEFVVPYAPAVVELEEGFSLLTDIVDCQDTDLRFHRPVEVVFHEVGDGVCLPCFRPRSQEVPCTTP